MAKHFMQATICKDDIKPLLEKNSIKTLLDPRSVPFFTLSKGFSCLLARGDVKGNTPKTGRFPFCTFFERYRNFEVIYRFICPFNLPIKVFNGFSRSINSYEGMIQFLGILWICPLFIIHPNQLFF